MELATEEERPAGGAPDDGGRPWTRAGSTLRSVVGHLTVSDVAALAVIAAATLHLVARDGGRNPTEALSALVVVSIGTVLLLPSLRRLPTSLIVVLAGLAIGPLVGVAAAEIRAGMARPLVAWAFVPGVTLATVHLWRRPWGPRALGAVLLLAALRSWYGTFLAWWGNAGGRPTWLALSWHNQSGTLMGAFGVAASAVAAAGRGRGRIALAVVAGGCLIGTWLSGSRGAVVATAVGLLAIAVVAVLRRPIRTTAVPLAVVAVTAVAILGGLEAMTGDGEGQPLSTRAQSASHNMSARFGHWEAAAGMAASRPLTGWGPGSYEWASRPHYPTDTNLTASAHNEYLEVLGETGLIGAAPVWVAAIAIGWFAIGALRRPRPPGVVAAAGAAIVLGLHAAIDFDWDYPVLLVLLTVAGSVLWVDRRPMATSPGGSGGPATSTAGRSLAVLTAIAVTVSLAAAVTVAATRPSAAPWNLDGRLSAAINAARGGDVDAARSSLERARAWNPGSPSLPVVAGVVEHQAGDLSDAELRASISPDHPVTSDHLLVAMRLVDARATTLASEVLDDLAATLEERRRWGVHQPVAMVAGLRLTIAAEDGGCASAEVLAPAAAAWAETFAVAREQVAAAHEATANGAVCDLSGHLGG